MNERPILFRAEMVRAILEDRKTQTRRLVKFPLKDPNFGCELAGSEINNERDIEQLCPYGIAGDHLWVKETFYDSRLDAPKHPVTYRADSSIDDDLNRYFRWKPSIFMPKWASRITLEVLDVRVERLQSITEADAKAEGVEPAIAGTNGRDHVRTYRTGYVRLWNAINIDKNGGKPGASWQSNPWVWRIEFRRVTPSPVLRTNE